MSRIFKRGKPGTYLLYSILVDTNEEDSEDSYSEIVRQIDLMHSDYGAKPLTDRDAAQHLLSFEGEGAPLRAARMSLAISKMTKRSIVRMEFRGLLLGQEPEELAKLVSGVPRSGAWVTQEAVQELSPDAEWDDCRDFNGNRWVRLRRLPKEE